MGVGQYKINAIRLVGGSPVLDFLNTCNGRRPGSSLVEVVDKLGSLSDIVRWHLHAGLIDEQQHAQDLALVQREAADLGPAFMSIKAFRETLYQLLLPAALGQPLNQVVLDRLADTLAAAGQRHRLVPESGGVRWVWLPNRNSAELADSYQGRLGLQAVELLSGSNLARLKACATCDCDWLFLDVSRNGRRRWCQMNICGSREKARRASVNDVEVR